MGCYRFLWFVFLIVLLFHTPVFAQLSITAPGTNGAKIAACDEYSAAVLNNPWDMSDAGDINTFIPTSDFIGLSNTAFSGGVFSATAATADPIFYLLSPALSSSVPSGGRFGQHYPIDTSKYRYLAIKMYTNTASYLQVVWHTGYDYLADWVMSGPITTSPGWNVYTIDLNNVTHLLSNGANLPWNAAPATGLRIDPTAVAGAAIFIDWIRLYGESGCGTHNAGLTANPVSGNSFYSLFIDEDNDPFNGFIQQLVTGAAAAGAATVPLTAQSLASTSYVINGFMTGDYATAARTNAWDMSQSADLLVTTDITADGGNGFNNGQFSGTTTSGSALIYPQLAAGGIDASKFSKLSLKIARSSRQLMTLVWVTAAGIQTIYLDPNVYDADGDNVYQVDVGALSNWSGTITSLALNPALTAGVHFDLDFISLQASEYVSVLETPSIVTSPGSLTVNQPPLMSILQPDAKGGAALRPWNMRATEDIPIVQNLLTAEILPNNTVNGLTGDFFHGANLSGSDDPINYSMFHTVNPTPFNSAIYHNLTYKLYVEGDVDVVLGSVARVNWANDLGAYGTTQDIVVFGGWNEYTLDLLTAEREHPATTAPWAGTIVSFRVDAHEFTPSRNYYFDYIHLRTDDSANSAFTIVYDVSDPDAAVRSSGNVALYYNSSPSTSGGTLIATLPLETPTGSYVWDTSGVPAGTYWIYATASDGLNSITRLSTGKVVVNHEWQDTTQPVLSIDVPNIGYTFDSWLQLKGYALDNVQLAQIEVHVDDQLFALVRPRFFNLAARTAYPDNPDSSNAGFNATYDTTSLSYGAHSVRVVAYDTSGNSTSSTYTLTRSQGAAPEIVSDPTPDGVPVGIPTQVGLLPNPKINSATIKKGKLSVKLSQLSQGCSASLLAGSKKTGSDLLASFTVSAADVSGATFSASKIPLPKQKLYVRVQASCGVNGTVQSSAKAVKISAGGSASYKQVLKVLKKKIKKA